MKYKAKHLGDGTYAVGSGKGFRHLPHTCTPDKRVAQIRALYMSGQWYEQQLQEIDRQLEELYVHDPARAYLRRDTQVRG